MTFAGRVFLEAQRLFDNGNNQVYLYEYVDNTVGELAKSSWPGMFQKLFNDPSLSCSSRPRYWTNVLGKIQSGVRETSNKSSG